MHSHSVPPQEAAPVETQSLTSLSAGLPISQLASIMDGITDGFTVFDRHWHILYMNQVSVRLLGRLGMSPEQVIGRSVWEILPDVVGTPIYDEHQRAMREGITREFEEYYEPLDAWFRIRLLPTQEGLLSYTQDITETKRAEIVLREQTRNLALGADVGKALTSGNTLDEMLAGCAEAIVLHLDAAFARIWLLQPEENVLVLKASAGMYTHLNGAHSRIPVGQYKIGLIAQESKPHLTNSVVGDPRVSDQEWAQREGMVAFAGYPLMVEGRLVGVMALFARRTLGQNILDTLASVANEIGIGIARKQAETALAAGTEWLSTTLSSIGDAVIATDAAGNLTFLNPVAQTLTGWTAEDALGRPLAEVFRIVNEYTGEPVENPVDKVLREGQIVGLANHTVLLAHDGSQRPIDDSAAPICGENGALSGVVLVFHDVTERRQAERHAEAQSRVSVALASSKDVTEASEKVLQAIGETLGWKLGILWLIDPNTGWLNPVKSWRADASEMGDFIEASFSIAIPPGEGLPGDVLQNVRPLWIERIDDYPPFIRKDSAKALGFQSAVAFPLVNGTAALGIVEFYHTQISHAVEGMLQTLEGLGHQIGQFIERRRAEEETLRAAALQSAVLASAMDCIISIDQDGNLIEWNPEAERTFGYTRDEVLGKEMAELIIPPAYRERHRQGLRHYLATGEGAVIGKRIEITALHQDGSEFPVELAINRTAGDPPRFTGFLRDIAEQQKITEALRASEARFRAAVQAVGDIIWTNDAAGRMMGEQPGWSAYTGQSREEYEGYGWADALHPDDAAPTVAAWREAVDGRRMFDFEHRVQRWDGVYRLFSIRSVPVLDAQGEIKEWVGVHADITDERRAVEEIERAKQAAEAAARAKSEFLATMSHEIRTPMNAVIGMTGLLLDTSLTPQQQEYAQIIRDSGDSLLNIINDILDFSKIEAGQMEVEQQPFDLRDCAESALDLVSARAAERGLDLAYLLAPEAPSTVVGDVTRVRQILVNLLSNAVKFTETGEVVLAISCAPLESGEFTIHFDVRDTGIGIPPERMDKLFQSFSQVDASTTRRYGGTGLGLAICRKLCDLMGGNIWAESVVGVGSTFHVALPMTVSPHSVHTRSQNDLVLMTGRRILIVDDNATNRQILSLQAHNWKMIPAECASAQEALERLQRGEQFDVAILDIQMPEMDGITLGREIQKCCRDRFMPLIGLSSVWQKMSETDAAGFAAMLTKPIKQSQLYDVLVSVLSTQPMPRHAEAMQRTASTGSVYDPKLAQQMPLRILIAEDLVVNQKLMQALLGKFGYRTDVAANGLEVLQALKRQWYDVILMDIQMPEMDGLEASRQLNALYGDERPCIVALTANAMQEDRGICLAAGMDDYLAKPVKPDELRDSLIRSWHWLHDKGRVTKEMETAVPVAVVEESTPDAMTPDTVAPSKSIPVEEIIDPPFLKELRSMPDILPELLETFRNDVGSRIAVMRRAVDEGDAATLSAAAHGVRGASGNVGGSRLARLCGELEERGRAGRVDGIAHLFPEIEQQFQQLCEALQILVEEQP